MTTPRKVVLYIATSLDGVIAQPGDDLSFLNLVQKEGEDYGYAAFTNTVDTVIMGRKTFDWVFQAINGVPHPDKDTYIITRTPRPATGRTQFYTGDLTELVLSLRAQPGGTIYCDGGAQLANALLRAGLLDECIISVVPVVLGAGTRLFADDLAQQKLHLLGSRAFDTGLVQLHYAVVRA